MKQRSKLTFSNVRFNVGVLKDYRATETLGQRYHCRAPVLYGNGILAWTR